MIVEFSDNGIKSTHGLRRRTEISSITQVPAIASDLWVCQLYTQNPSASGSLRLLGYAIDRRALIWNIAVLRKCVSSMDVGHQQCLLQK